MQTISQPGCEPKTKVFCIGLGKTGTSTFGEIMRQCGYKHSEGPVHIGLAAFKVQDLETLFRISEMFDSFDDYPWPFLYRVMHEKYPDAKFVLTKRENPDTWWKSLNTHNLRQGPKDNQLMSLNGYLPAQNAAELKEFYLRHIEEVREYFSGSENFIEICWNDQEARSKLVSFIGLDFSGEVPHQNAAQDKDPRELIDGLLKGSRPGAALLFADSQSAEVQKYAADSVRSYIQACCRKRFPEEWVAETQKLGSARKLWEKVKFHFLFK
ncbi:sulfotransferase [Ruegeria atlantica]|uniref:sulfotransferase n=1 Tax=Ruegeria atlantica TaxID=81569 RepID=UPI00147F43B9|nr:sulfotransferase [Ruegeria atlantica]